MDKVDLGLLTRLQNRVKELEREKGRLQRELDHKETLHDRSGSHGIPGIDSEREIYDTIKVIHLHPNTKYIVNRFMCDYVTGENVVLKPADFLTLSLSNINQNDDIYSKKYKRLYLDRVYFTEMSNDKLPKFEKRNTVWWFTSSDLVALNVYFIEQIPEKAAALKDELKVWLSLAFSSLKTYFTTVITS